jgi:hypothetical protein
VVKHRIFVSIASYRDSELARTVRDLLSHAVRPEAVSIAIFDQSDEPIATPRRTRGARIIHERCSAQESQGACWARAQLQRHFDGEDFYLQLDSHHLFKDGWDKLLIDQLAACPAQRPVLTEYLPPYEVRAGRAKRMALASTAIHVSHFDSDGVVLYRSHCYKREISRKPTRGRFFSGHFVFARRDFVEAVPYDPDLYFFGEESTMAARAFTHGFDLFHPGRTVAWHHYLRKGRPRHWEDHAKSATNGEGEWVHLQRRSVEKYRRIFCLLPHVSAPDGLGTQRTLQEYEAWAGVDHYWQLVHPATAALQEPPASASANWTVDEGLLSQAHLLVRLPPLRSFEQRPSCEIHLAIVDATSRDAAARRVTPDEYGALARSGWTVSVRYKTAPLRLIVWPRIPEFGWGEKYEVHLHLPGLANAKANPARRAQSKKRPHRATVLHSRWR